MMLLDFSRKVRAFSAQPFWLSWPAGGKVRNHAPDLFVRLADGGGMVVDVRPDDRIEPEDAEAFEATAEACASVGWGYRRLGVPDPVLAGNVRGWRDTGTRAACARITGPGCWRRSPLPGRCWPARCRPATGSRCSRRCIT